MGNELTDGIVMGIGFSTVFVGLISLVLLIWLMGLILKPFLAKTVLEQKTPPAVSAAPVSQTPPPIENRAALIAAISACLAEEMGEDISAIAIRSLKRL